MLSSAQVLAQQLNSMTAQIQGLRSDAELGLADAVRNANDAMQRIAQINQQLGTANANDGDHSRPRWTSATATSTSSRS